MNRKQIVIAGGSGFIGRALAAELSAHHFQVVILTRTPRERTDGVREVAWDGKTPGAWTQTLDGARAVVNLTGRNINCPHTPENLAAITASRVDSVNALAAAIAQAQLPPRVWVQASAVGFYGDTGDTACDENAPAGRNALADICRRWEAAFTAATVPETRKVTLRIGMVLGRDGGALPVLSKLARWCLGGAAGSGRQYVSWIHLADLVKLFIVAIGRDNLHDVFNAVAPVAVTNAEFMAELRRVLKRPWSPPAPEFAVHLGARLMGSEPTLALISQRCTPAKFLEMELRYQFPELAGALENLCAKKLADKTREKKNDVRIN
jgi:uncharacterized protein (TIGR01777 family)